MDRNVEHPSSEYLLALAMQPRQPLVMHVIPGLGAGGAEHMLANLVTAPRREPYRQVVVNLFHGGINSERIRASAVDVIELGISHPAFLPCAIHRLCRIIRDTRPDVIQSWLYYGDLFAYAALQLSNRRAATRLYWGVRCSDLDLSQYPWILRQSISLCARLSAKPDAVVANSFAGRDAHRRIGYSPRAFPVIPNGVDTTRFRPDATANKQTRADLGIADDRPVVIHVARVDPMKDHANLLAAAQALPEAIFVLVGLRTDQLKTPNNVRALGARNDMPSLYAAADIAVSSSTFGEGFSNAIAEAMASGVPVVATDVGDAAAIVGTAGLLVPPRDSHALRGAIEALLKESVTSRHARRMACRHHIEQHFSIDRAVATFDRLFFHGTVPNDGAAVATRR